MQGGLSWGSIALSGTDFHPGNYVIRAYTQWMRNFDEGGFYYKRIRIAGAGEDGWFINESITATDTADKQNIRAKFQFAEMDRSPVANKPMALQVLSGNRSFYRQTLSTGQDGLLDISFILPGKPLPVFIVAQNEAKSKKTIIPVTSAVGKNIDLQFLPEGGVLIAGFNTLIGVKAVADNGKGINVSGMVIDQDQKQVASFKSLHSGIGSFGFPG